MTPRLESCYFASDPAINEQMERMARVLRATAHMYCPDWTINIVRLKAERLPTTHGSEAHIANTQKLEYWNAVIQQAADGACVLLMDTDTFITRPLNDLWTCPFEVAYTVRTGYHGYPLNAGVVAIRVSPASRTFMQRWTDENGRMLNDRALHKEWRSTRRFGGINQAALGKLLSTEYAPGPHCPAHIVSLACLEWNCEESAWAQFDERVTRIVHVKSMLRWAVFTSSRDTGLRELAMRWKMLEAAALKADRTERKVGA